MADQQEWTPERLRALDRAVAEARGWRPDVGYCTPDGKASWLAPVSLGTRETFELMDAFRTVRWELTQDRLGRFLIAWCDDEWDEWGAPVVGPTIPISICLAYLASKGRPFNG